MRYGLFFLLCLLMMSAEGQKAKLVIPVSHSAGVVAVKPSADGSIVITSGKDRLLKIWNGEGKLLRTIPTPHVVRKIFISPTGTHFFAVYGFYAQFLGSTEEGILYDMFGEPLYQVSSQDTISLSPLFSPNGATFSPGWRDDQRLVMDLSTSTTRTVSWAEANELFRPTGETYIGAFRILERRYENGQAVNDTVTPLPDRYSAGKLDDPQAVPDHLYQFNPALRHVGDHYYLGYGNGDLWYYHRAQGVWRNLAAGLEDYQDPMYNVGAIVVPVSWNLLLTSPDERWLVHSTPTGNRLFARQGDELRVIDLPASLRLDSTIRSGNYRNDFTYPISFSPDSRYLLFRTKYHQQAAVYDLSAQRIVGEFKNLDLAFNHAGDRDIPIHETPPIQFLPGHNQLLHGGIEGELTKSSPSGVYGGRQFCVQPPRYLAGARMRESAKTPTLEVLLRPELPEVGNTLHTFDLTNALLRGDSLTTVTDTAYVHERAPTIKQNEDAWGPYAATSSEDINYVYQERFANPGAYVDMGAGRVYLRDATGPFVFKPSSSVYDLKLTRSPNPELIVNHSEGPVERYDLGCLRDAYDALPEENGDSVLLSEPARGCLRQVSPIPARSYVHGSEADRRESLFSQDGWLYRTHWDHAAVDSVRAHDIDLLGAEFFLDGRYVYTWSEDRSLKIWGADHLNLLLTIIFLDDRNWVATTPAGLFDASGAAMNQLYFSLGTEIIDARQLEQRYYEPGLIPKTLGLAVGGVRRVLEMGEETLYPEIMASIEGDILNVQLKERAGGVGNTSVFLNGKEIITDARPEGQMEFTVPLTDYARYCYRDSYKTNTVAVVSHNAEGWLES
ncbi:MAG: hypothetical protein AAFZ52_14495, partial [Bacteroidota bacterium]